MRRHNSAHDLWRRSGRAAASKDRCYEAQFNRLQARREKAVRTVAASMLTALYPMLKDGTGHQDLGADHFDRRSGHDQRQVRAQIAEFGFAVELRQPKPHEPDAPAGFLCRNPGGHAVNRLTSRMALPTVVRLSGRQVRPYDYSVMWRSSSRNVPLRINGGSGRD
jgi:hypothetical protein